MSEKFSQNRIPDEPKSEKENNKTEIDELEQYESNNLEDKEFER